MKTRVVTVIAITTLLMVAQASRPVSAHAQVPGLINYQGRIVDGGTNFDGTGQFQFALVDGTGTNTFWSNDGSSNGGSQPTSSVVVAVSKGLYSILLGDSTLPNMTSIPTSVFANTDVRLRIWFNDGVTGVQQLSPDQRIAAVGFSMMSATVPDSSITSNKIAAGAVVPSALAVGLMNAFDISNNFVTTSQITNIANLVTNGVLTTTAGILSEVQVNNGTLLASASGFTYSPNWLSFTSATAQVFFSLPPNDGLQNVPFRINSATDDVPVDFVTEQFDDSFLAVSCDPTGTGVEHGNPPMNMYFGIRSYAGNLGAIQLNDGGGSNSTIDIGSDGVNTGIGEWNQINTGPLTVMGDLQIQGKVYETGGVDPPYILLDAQTRAGVARRLAREVPADKQTGAALFWNPNTHRLEVYVGADGSFYNLAGELITNIPPPVVAATDTVTYALDPDTGQLTTLSHRKAIRWEIQRGFQMRADGTFWDISHSNQPPVQVTRGQAVRQQGP